MTARPWPRLKSSTSMHTSPSVWVKYALTSDPAQIDPRLAGKKVKTIIWTTTPWTLPASHGRRLPSRSRIRCPGTGGEVYIVAEALAEATQEAVGFSDARSDRALSRHASLSAYLRHPFLDRSILGVLGRLCHHRARHRRRPHRARPMAPTTSTPARSTVWTRRATWMQLAACTTVCRNTKA